MIKVNIYYWNNGVGLKNDIILLTQVLKEFDVVIYDISKEIINRKSDIGIFIQNIYETYMNDNKINILIPNEEWLSNDELIYLHNFDYIFVKSKYAKSILDQYHKNIIITGFFSLDRYFFTKNNKEILFLKGKSIQKNHELIRNYKEKINILDANHKYLNENELVYELNNHNIHICCSLYEAWGHYLWEAMSSFRFIYEGGDFEDEGNSPFPSKTTIESFHEFADDQTWETILWQFCKFLEHTGFEGVRKRVIIEGLRHECLFQDFFNREVNTDELLEDYIEALDKTDKDAL